MITFGNIAIPGIEKLGSLDCCINALSECSFFEFGITEDYIRNFCMLAQDSEWDKL